jgi:hypothetical protein
VAFFRWYFLRNPKDSRRFNLFLQAGAGAGIYYFYGEKAETSPLFLGEGLFGIRMQLGKRFFIEPYIRGGYPSLWGAGIVIGG